MERWVGARSRQLKRLGDGGGAAEVSVRVQSCASGRLTGQPCGQRGGVGRNIRKPML